MRPVSQWRTIFAQGLQAELADKERLLSPVLFAITILILFTFAFGEVPEDMRVPTYLAETFLTAFFALQISFSRVFEPDRQDRVFDLMLTYPISYTAWFLAKYFLVAILGALIVIPTMCVAALLHQGGGIALLSWPLLAIALLSLAGLAALGVLLSAMTLKANGRQILYPILYFPLSTPVLLAAVQGALLYYDTGRMTENVFAWLGLLSAFDIIYITLGILLFSEIVDET